MGNKEISRKIQRIPGMAPGRSSASAIRSLVFAVASADEKGGDIRDQTGLTFKKVDRLLAAAGSEKSCILSATVYLADLQEKKTFDECWREWVGDHPADWPQRACIGAILSPGTRVEISIIAFRDEN